MSQHDIDRILTTTRAVRRKLDLDRDVPQALVDECLTIAQQAPTGGNREVTRFVVVRDPSTRAALADIYRKGWAKYMDPSSGAGAKKRSGDVAAERQRRVVASSLHLAENLERVPVHIVPCVRPRTDTASIVLQASTFGSVYPSVWSFMLAARARGLGTTLTTLHLFEEGEAAELLGIPDHFQQVGLIPVAYATTTDFSPAPRRPLEEFRSIDRWPAD